MREIEKRGFAEELVSLININDYLVAVIGKTRDLHFSVDNEINRR